METSLRVLLPPKDEPISVETLKAHARADADLDDELIETYITAAREWIEGYLARALMPQTLVWTVRQRQHHGIPGQIIPLLSFPMGWSCPAGGHRPLELTRCPVQSVETVTVTRLDGTEEVLDPTTYVADLALDPATIRLMPQAYAAPIAQLRVQYVAGYEDQAIPRPILLAMMLLATHFYENRGDTDADPPKTVLALLSPYRVMFFGG